MSYKIKLSLFSSLFRFFSFLSDKSRGNAFFVKYKILLGSMVIGLSVSGCVREETPITCYVAPPPEVMCYDVGPTSAVSSAPDQGIEDESVKKGE